MPGLLEAFSASAYLLLFKPGGHEITGTFVVVQVAIGSAFDAFNDRITDHPGSNNFAAVPRR